MFGICLRQMAKEMLPKLGGEGGGLRWGGESARRWRPMISKDHLANKWVFGDDLNIPFLKK